MCNGFGNIIQCRSLQIFDSLWVIVSLLGAILCPKTILKHPMLVNIRFLQDGIIKRELERDQQNRERIRLEQELVETQEDNARFLANAQHERDQVIKEIEKVR